MYGRGIINEEKMKIAIIGCGRFCKFFVPLFKAHPVIEKVYVCDLISERAENYSKQFGVDIISSFEEALASKEINAVAIFTQRYKHGPMVIQALNAGKHVYSAVPDAIDVSEIKEIERLVSKTRLTYSMGETGYYRAPAIFCREQFKRGAFGKFVYGEAQYNHDIRNMEMSFRSSGGDDWKRFAGVPPFYYPTHSTSMVLSAMPGVYAKKVMALGFEGHQDRPNIYGRENLNNYGNPFSMQSMLVELSNGGIMRINENRCIGWKAPETYISQFFGDKGGYEFSVARHSFAVWDENIPANHKQTANVVMKDVTKLLQPSDIFESINDNYDYAIQRIADGWGFFSESPIQPTSRLPKKFCGIENGHNGTHHFLIDDFCRAYETGKLSPTNIWEVARWNIPGLLAHESAMQGGKAIEVPDLGNPPDDWEVLDLDSDIVRSLV